MKSPSLRRLSARLLASCAAVLVIVFSSAGCGMRTYSMGPRGDGELIRQEGGLWGVPQPYRLELKPVPLNEAGRYALRIDRMPEHDYSRPHLSLVVRSTAKREAGPATHPVLRIRIADSRGKTLVTRTIGKAPRSWEVRGADSRTPELAQSIPADAFPPRGSAPVGLTLTVEVLQPSSVPGSSLYITAY